MATCVTCGRSISTVVTVLISGHLEASMCRRCIKANRLADPDQTIEVPTKGH